MRTRTDTIPRRIQRPGIFASGDGSTLSLDFTAMSSLDSRFIFTRSSTATFINSLGYVQFANANLMTYSNPRQTGTAWAATGTVTWNGTGGISDPTGGTNAQSITFGTAASAIFNTTGTTVVSGLTHTFSVWLRAASGTTNVRIGDANVGAVSTVVLTTTWQRFSCQYTTSGTNDGGAIYSQTGTASAEFYVWGAQVQPGSITGDLLETTGSLNRNTPRFDYDPTTLTARGLLIEAAASNYALSSEAFSTSYWGNNGLNGSAPTSTGQTNPNNTASSIQFVEDTSTGAHGAYQSVSGLTAGTVYTLSAWVKSDGTRNFASLRLTVSGGNPSYSAVWSLTDGTPGNTLTTGSPTSTSRSIAAYRNGWYRIQISMACPATFTAMIGYVNGSNTNTITNQPQAYTGTATKGIYVWGAQLEAGPASSYIPTVASQGQRTVDSCVMSGTNFSSWFNASQGTILTTWSGTGVTSGRYATINDGSASNQIWTGFSESAIYNGSFQASFGSAGTANGKVALAYLLNDAAWCLNGGSVSTDTAVTLPTGLNQISIGNSQAGTAAIGTALRTVKYFPLRLTNAQLQAITA